jgi:AraC-like DNA-binding protein
MSTVEFRDCDAYFDAINNVNVRFTLQGLETSAWRIDVLPLPSGINVQYCWSGSGALAQGVSRAGGFNLAVPASGHYTANGTPVPVGSSLLMVAGSEFLASIPKSHSWFGIFVPEPLAISVGLPENSSGYAATGTRIVHNAAPAGCSVPSLLTRFFANALAAPEMTLSARALGRFETELLATLQIAYGHLPRQARRRAGRPPVVDHVAVNRALRAIEASTEPMIAMSELVQLTQVSERSLRAAFRKYLGMPPTRYMQLRTLNRARRRLTASRPKKTTVAEVAADLGVWDLGRFAARYRRLFGELPSATLRKTN